MQVIVLRNQSLSFMRNIEMKKCKLSINVVPIIGLDKLPFPLLSLVASSKATKAQLSLATEPDHPLHKQILTYW